MTRTKKMLLAALAGMLFAGVVVGAEIADTNDRAAYPEPIPTRMEPYQGQSLAEGECPEFMATEAEPFTGLSVTCDRHLVVVE